MFKLLSFFTFIFINVDDDRHYGEHLDSLGRAPTCTFERYMNEHCREWIYNCKQLQSILRTLLCRCACLCIVTSKGIDIRRFMRYFTRCTGLSNVIVHATCSSSVTIKRLKYILFFYYTHTHTIRLIIHYTKVYQKKYLFFTKPLEIQSLSKRASSTFYRHPG